MRGVFVPVVVYNPTIGRYIAAPTSTTQQANPAQIKTQVGAQAPLAAASTSSVKVSISSQAQAATGSGYVVGLESLLDKLNKPVSSFKTSDFGPMTLTLKNYADLAIGAAVRTEIGTVVTKEVQSIRVDGTIANGDEYDFALSPPGVNVSPVKLHIGPLAIPFGAQDSDRLDALKSALNIAIAAKPELNQGGTPLVQIERSGTQFQIKYQSAAPVATLVTLTNTARKSELSQLDSPPMSATAKSNLLSLIDDKKIVSLRTANAKTAAMSLAGMQGVDAKILNLYSGAIALDIPANKENVASSIDPAVLTKIKTLGQANKITSLTFGGSNPVLNLTAADVTALGPNLWARYSSLNPMSINDNATNLTKAENWESLRQLNNFRELNIKMDAGIPAGLDGKPAALSSAADLTKLNMGLSYDQFVSGYSLLKSMKPISRAVDFSAPTKTLAGSGAVAEQQSLAISGNILSGAEFDLSLKLPDGSADTLHIGPLNIPAGTRIEDRLDIFKSAIAADLSLSSKFNGSSGPLVQVSRNLNQLVFSYAGTSYADASHSFEASFTQGTTGIEDDLTKIVDVTDVPPASVQTLASYSEVRSVSLKGAANSVLSSYDKLNSYATSGYLKKITLTDIGDIKVTGSLANKSIPLIEKIEDKKFSISDKPFAPTSYAQFTPAAAAKLAASVDVSGTFADILSSLDGMAALSAAGKLHSLNVTDLAQGTIEISGARAASLVSVISKLPQTFKVKVNGDVSLADATKLADPAIKSRLASKMYIVDDGSGLTQTNVDKIRDVLDSVKGINITKPVTSAQYYYLKSPTPALPIDGTISVVDTASNLLAQKAGLVNILSGPKSPNLGSIDVTGAFSVSDALDIGNSQLINYISTGLRIADTKAQIIAQKTPLETLANTGKIRSLQANDSSDAELKTALGTSSLNDLVFTPS